jgi:hypothetical protein
MKHILHLLILTVMLKVAWPQYTRYGHVTKAGSGIVTGWVVKDITTSYAIVVTEDSMVEIEESAIYDWIWVEVRPHGLWRKK